MMLLKKWVQIILVGASVLSLAACSSARKPMSDSAVGDENAAYSDAQSSGAGDDNGFDDGSSNRRQVASGRVYHFDFNSDAIRQDDMPAINSNAKKLAAQSGMNALVEGHTDPRGSREYNIGLGERRAKSVAQVLSQKGVDPSQLRVVSYGAEKLASAGRSEADYQQDRRAVLVYVQR